MQYAKPVTLNVEECDRLSFLPYLFGNDFLYAEAYVYALAKKMMPEYEGGFWHFIRLPDGGGYMMPDGDRFHMATLVDTGRVNLLDGQRHDAVLSRRFGRHFTDDSTACHYKNAITHA